MKPIHASFWATALAGIAASQLAFAKTPASQPPAPSKPSSSEPSATERNEAWAREQSNAARKEWAKDKTKRAPSAADNTKNCREERAGRFLSMHDWLRLCRA